MRIDAHQHYWRLDRGDYGWLSPEMNTLYRDYQPSDLEPALARHRIGGTILIQAAQTHAETDYLLSLAAAHDSVAGVVGWLDYDDPSWPDALARFAGHPKFKGVRLMMQEMADPREALRPHVVAAMRRFAEEGLPVDLLVLSDQLPALQELLDRVPGLHGVIDHLAKPRIAAGEFEPWASQMAAIAKLHPNISCKLSGMVTEADHAGWEQANFVPYVRHIVRCFGASRVMFGSDWPVCLLAAEYDEVMDVLAQAMPDSFGEAELAGIYGGNAASFYRLEGGAERT